MATPEQIQSYYWDLQNRGGNWIMAAQEFLQAVDAVGEAKADAYALYKPIFDKYEAGKGTPLPTTTTAPTITTPTTTAPTIPSTPYAAPWRTETYGERPSFLSRYGLTTDYRNPYQRWQEQFYNPLATMFGLQQQLGIVPGQAQAPSWEGYLPQDPSAAYGMAQQMLKNIYGLTQEQRGLGGLTFEQGDEATMGQLRQLMGYGLRPQLGRYGASFLAGRLPEEQARWAAIQPTTGPPTGGTFLDYLRQRYGLERFGV